MKTEMEIVQQQEDLIIFVEEVRSILRKVPNWKAARLDEILGFWIKDFQNLHERMVDYPHNYLNTRECAK